MATSTETLHMILSAEDRSSSILGRVGLSIGAITAAVDGLVAMTKQVANVGDELDKMSIKTGVAVEELSALKLAADLNDVSLEELRIGLTFLQRNLADAAAGGGEAAKALQEMGFEQDHLESGLKDATGFLEAFARTLFEIPDAAKRTQLAMDVLGRSGANLLPLMQDLAQRGLKGLQEESDRLGVTWTKEMTEASQRFNDSLTRLSTSIQSLRNRFIAPLIKDLADLADKFGLGGPEARKRVEVESRLSAIEGIRLGLNQQLQVAAEMREKGLRSGIASDAIFNKMLQSGNDLIAERSKLLAELGGMEAKKPQAGGLADPAAAAATKQIGTALDVVRQRISELFRAGVAPVTEEFKRMIETVRLAELQAHKAFGIDIPESLKQSFSETNKWVLELGKAANIDLEPIIKGLPALLGQAGSTAKGFGQIWDSETGEIIAFLDEGKQSANELKGIIEAASGETFELREESSKLPQTLEEWKKPLEDTITLFTTVKGEIKTIMADLKVVPGLIADINAKGGVKLFATNIEEVLKRQKLVSNEP